MSLTRSFISDFSKYYRWSQRTKIKYKLHYDRVIHDIMLYKLLRIGIAGNFYSVIKDTYVGNNLKVTMKNGFTQLVLSTIGVRQDDTLSSDLFKIFINDLPDIFDHSWLD